MKRSICIAVVLGAIALAAWYFFGGEPRRRSVILISIDSLRPDHLGCYGYTRPTSPVLDRFASEGALFETALSSTSWTLPAHAAMLTGLPDRVHGCFGPDRWLPGSRETLAEALRENGYRTVGFFSGPYLHPCFGLGQGFDTYHDCTSYSEKIIRTLKRGERQSYDPRRHRDVANLAQTDVTNPNILKEVTRWLDSGADGPFFAFIHVFDVHFHYIPPAPYNTMFLSGRRLLPLGGLPAPYFQRRQPGWTDAHMEQLEALYDGEIRYTDDMLGRLFAALRERGLYDETVIVVTADHGEAFWEHAYQGHHLTLYEEEIRIPLLIRCPPLIPAGQRIRPPAHITDIAPTLMELSGNEGLTHALGRDLSPLLRDPSAAWEDTPLVSELTSSPLGRPLFALRTSTWKMIAETTTSRFHVFDLTRDPHERSPLPEDRGPVPAHELQKLYIDARRRLDRAARELPRPGERDTPPISRMTEAQLRSLGYLK